MIIIIIIINWTREVNKVFAFLKKKNMLIDYGGDLGSMFYFFFIAKKDF